MEALAWRSIGPAVGGGRLGAIAGTNQNPSLVYIGAAGGGVWRSTNAMTSWQPVFDKQRVSAIGSIAIDPSDADDVWVGTGESNPRNDVSYGDGMYRSTNGGKTWTHLGLDRSYAISKIELDPRDAKVAVVAALGDPFADSTERGIYRTTDGGATWKQTLVLGPDSGGADLTRSATAPNVLFAAMWQFRRSSWHLVSGGERDGLFKSTDGGATWKRVSGNGFPGGITGRIGVAIAPSDARRVYAIVESNDGLVWRSDDGGTTWKMISANTLVDERPFYYSRVFVAPHDEDHLFATSVRLAESKNGGATWQLSGRHLHGDHHVMWFSADGRRVLEGDDGGPAVSNDNGATWEWRNNVPIEQVYRVATDKRTPYAVCAGLQDNGAWCGPSDGRSDEGILAKDWDRVGGGDGNWTIPDPTDDDLIWGSSGGGDNGGEVTRYDRATRLSLDVSPYLRNQNVVAPAQLAYRFNWETPLAFSPFDGRIAYCGGNALFETSDRGVHWKRVSPDLTRNIRARQILSGTPLRLDVTGAETYDTILDVVPSTVAPGELWVTTDDGKVQLTRDAGAHWRDVTMPAADMDARVPTLEASHRDPATAYAVIDRHFTGDRTPYVYATNDYGRTWRTATTGLPPDQFARSIAEDPHDPDVLVLGLENGVWWSGDRGSTWRSLQQNLPPASVRDLRFASNGRDLVAGTHGRGIWILDDAIALERAKGPAATELLSPGIAHQYEMNTPTFNASASGENPAGPALFTFRLAAPAKTAPKIESADATGRVVRTFAGEHEVDGEMVPVVTNRAGFNRIAWDLTGDAPVPWYRAPKWNRGPDNGPDLLPGTYRVRLEVDGAVYTRDLTIAPDTRVHQTPSERMAHVTYLTQLYAELSRIDVALNELDALQAALPDRTTGAIGARADGTVTRAAADVAAEAAHESATLSSHPVNGQDNDFLQDLLRERVQSLGNIASTLSPTAEQTRESAALRTEVDAALDAHARFMRDRVAPLQRLLVRSGLAPIDLEAKPAFVKPDPKDDEHGSRREDD
ncbi:MAG: hypothetical protein IAI48_12400 [Candidatus Eremiobacteraeota bacterium]|nr:hypothetical protein [Candidatus Eremiobacteraeota bacterium]